MSLPSTASAHQNHTTPPPHSLSNNHDASLTQLTEIPTQPFTQNEDSLLSPLESTSPPPKQMRWWGKLIPCSSESSFPPIQLFPKSSNASTGIAPMVEDVYTIGRSTKCDIQVERFVRSSDSDHQKKRAAWAYGLISNRHCSIVCTPTAFKLKDGSGNGTVVNDSVIGKGNETHLSSGDSICLLNPATVQKKIRGSELQALLQEYSFVFVPNNIYTTAKPTSAVRVRSLAPSLGQQHRRLYPANAPSSKALSIEADYELGGVLGTGTVGEVRRAVHKRTGEAVAVKVLGRSMLAAEASILRDLNHPNIVRLIDVYYESHTVYIVMELMEKDLFSCIVEKERFNESKARFIMRRLLAALHYLHEDAQVVHRDLKPENILLRGDKDVKLTDFGLAKQDKKGGLRTFCGTPQYFAPEVLNRAHTVLGQGRYGKAADLWSVGVVLYVMLTGCTPQMDAKSEIVWDEADHMLSKDAKDLILRLLDPNPNSRLTVVQCCSHPWILVTDLDDTHQHPLDDPALKKMATADVNTKTRSASEVNQKHKGLVNTPVGDIASPNNLQPLQSSEKSAQRLPLSPMNSSSKHHAYAPSKATPCDFAVPLSVAKPEPRLDTSMNPVSPLVPFDLALPAASSVRRVSGSADKRKFPLDPETSKKSKPDGEASKRKQSSLTSWVQS